MLAVDWKLWFKNPAQDPVIRKVRVDDYLWEDAVTGTFFSIARKEYHRLQSELEQYLATLSTDERYDILSKRYLPFGQHEDIELAIHLPYPLPLKADEWKNTPTRIRTRLADHVLLRTGLYYAVHFLGISGFFIFWLWFSTIYIVMEL